jgi:hypothetical protein
MEPTHLFEGHIYVISNTAVAKNPLFNNKTYCRRFLEKMNYYLSDLCEILHYNIDKNQYQLIVRLFDRKQICAYYRNKHSEWELEEHEIPFTTHIFSQAMANLQSSTAIHFNRKECRFGALFARRFSRELVKSQTELDAWIEHFHKMKRMYVQSRRWDFKGTKRRNWVKKKRLKERNGYYYYLNTVQQHTVLRSFIAVNKIQLQGQFEILPPKNIFENFSKLEMYFYLKKLQNPG